MEYKLQQGDNLELLKQLPDNSVKVIQQDVMLGIFGKRDMMVRPY